MIVLKKKFIMGLLLLVTFFMVLVLFFLPLYNGQNGLAFLDDLFNSISKGSAYYIPGVQKQVAEFSAQEEIRVDLDLATDERARQTALLFTHAGITAEVSGASVHVSGDLVQILKSSLADADSMYHNNGQAIAQKYAYAEKQVMFNWWSALKEMQTALTQQEQFKAAQLITLVQNRAVETAYNYYTIEPRSVRSLWGIMVFSLVFYVVYTLWYGYAIMFMFEGIGMKLEH